MVEVGMGKSVRIVVVKVEVIVMRVVVVSFLSLAGRLMVEIDEDVHVRVSARVTVCISVLKRKDEQNGTAISQSGLTSSRYRNSWRRPSSPQGIVLLVRFFELDREPATAHPAKRLCTRINTSFIVKIRAVGEVFEQI
jgi:hypothetical protein